jgi:heme-degrading monooxygenase HmoA
MFARVSTLHGPPDLLEESIRVIRQEVLPAFRQRPGFNGILSLMNQERGTSITISLWQSEADMQASDKEAQSLRAGAAEAGDDQILSVERFEVGLYEMSR